jgi:hypothetical protein
MEWSKMVWSSPNQCPADQKDPLFSSFWLASLRIWHSAPTPPFLCWPDLAVPMVIPLSIYSHLKAQVSCWIQARGTNLKPNQLQRASSIRAAYEHYVTCSAQLISLCRAVGHWTLIPT